MLSSFAESANWMQEAKKVRRVRFEVLKLHGVVAGDVTTRFLLVLPALRPQDGFAASDSDVRMVGGGRNSGTVTWTVMSGSLHACRRCGIRDECARSLPWLVGGWRRRLVVFCVPLHWR